VISLKFDEVDEDEWEEEKRDSAKDLIQGFLEGGVGVIKVDLRGVRYSSPTNFVNAVRVYIRHHGLSDKIKIRRRGWELFLKRI